MELFGSSGIRGVANNELTPTFAVNVAAAAGTVLDADRVAVAQDTRTTGSLLTAGVASGFASVGATVERLGVLPTPALQAYCESEAIPGIAVTASHNPPADNGFKLIASDGVEPDASILEQIESVYNQAQSEPARWDEVGIIESVDGAREHYLDELIDAIDREQIAEAGLTVAIDPGHGAGCLTSPTFFRQLGCRVITVNAHPDGEFPGRDPEPVPDNLDDLQRLVTAGDADIGIAHDGDADRAIFIDETGQYIEGDTTLAALAAAELESGDTTVSAVTVSQRLVDVVDDVGASLAMTPVGSTNIIARIRDLQNSGESVPIAGEGNGGVIFSQYRLARDGAYTAGRFLELLTERPASAIAADYSGYANVRRTIPYDTTTEREALLSAAESYASNAEAELTTIDGYRLDYDDGWVLIRASGTEPVIRIYAEARDETRATSLSQSLIASLERAGSQS